jgi:hypothetical protein
MIVKIKICKKKDRFIKYLLLVSLSRPLSTPHPFLTTPHPFLSTPHPFLSTPHPFLSTPHPFLTTPHPFLSTPHPFLTNIPFNHSSLPVIPLKQAAITYNASIVQEGVTT